MEINFWFGHPVGVSSDDNLFSGRQAATFETCLNGCTFKTTADVLSPNDHIRYTTPSPLSLILFFILISNYVATFFCQESEREKEKKKKKKERKKREQKRKRRKKGIYIYIKKRGITRDQTLHCRFSCMTTTHQLMKLELEYKSIKNK